MLLSSKKFILCSIALILLSVLNSGCNSLSHFFQPQKPANEPEITLYSGKILETSSENYFKFQEKDGSVWNVWVNEDTKIRRQSETEPGSKMLLFSDLQPDNECNIKAYVKNPGSNQNGGTPGILLATEVTLQWIESKQVTYSVFYNNTIKDPNMLDCSKVYPVDRIADEDAIFEEILLLLFEGPTEEEKKQGYVSAIPNDVVINFIVRNNGKMHVDFKPFQIAGACATGAFAAQVTQTLLAIPGTKEVLISIMGQTEGILQP
ncbi:GerMN domain-containing protein [bacterium]|nr:GerMN domain-containing protein [bacterium]